MKNHSKINHVSDGGKTEKTFVLFINHDEHNDSVIYKIKDGARLHFSPGPSLLGKLLALYCNYPREGCDFKRNSYNLLNWYCGKTGRRIDLPKSLYTTITDTDMYCEIVPHLPGSYHYYFNYGTEPDAPHQGSGYFSKDPGLEVGPDSCKILLQPDAIRCQTVLTKSLGLFNTWESKLRITKESGYNMIHFTPIQELGGSNSSYSISNQLKLNNSIDSKDQIKFEDIGIFLKKLEEKWEVTSMCDIVLNHTSNDSKWLLEHANSAYNCSNSPHLRPAALLDYMFSQLSNDVKSGVLRSYGISDNITNDAELETLRKIINEEYLPKLKTWEFYQVNVELLTQYFSNKFLNIDDPTFIFDIEDIKIIQDAEYRRFKSTVNNSDSHFIKRKLNGSVDILNKKLHELNYNIYVEIQKHMTSAVDNALSGIRYERIQEDGPKYSVIDDKHPLFSRYFTDFDKSINNLEDAEKMIYSEKGQFTMAHNGWVMNFDPLMDFAKNQYETGNVYLRRELIAWSDCVKLRYGENPEDSPYLWEHMRNYVEQTARVFHGVRLDNCHSTPLHVAEYMLDCARKIRPHLYVVAELFTNSDSKDNIFVNRLGITTLVREAQSAWDSHELGRLVYRYGGDPVGAFRKPPHECDISKNNQKPKLIPAIANALFMDLTHDNPSPVEKRSVYDLLPTSALVSMACCGTGSNRGYDELVPHHINVVNESREYASWSKYSKESSGIIVAKNCLNNLHSTLSDEGFNEVYVDQMNENIVAVTRHNPSTHESVILVAYTCFEQPTKHWPISTPHLRPICFEGHLDIILLEAELKYKLSFDYEKPMNYIKDENIINGLSEYYVNLRQNIDLDESLILDHIAKSNGSLTELKFTHFKPGSVLAIRVSLDSKAKESINQLHLLISSMNNDTNEMLQSIVSKLDLNQSNEILYKCDQEERDDGKGFGVYDIPNYGPLVYCGLQGFMSLLEDIKQSNDLGHPMCCNLRDGNWMIDYIWQRLQNKEGLSDLSKWINENFEPLKHIPRYLIPSYFEAMISPLYSIIRKHSISSMSGFIRNGDSFTKMLGMATMQFTSICESAKLPPFSPNLIPSLDNSNCSTISAGLPHFATGYMRCWGRDTFISLRGILLLTGRFSEARQMILGFGACLRHGLIPNLLSGGYNARYNCRDAVWWWLECIKSHVNLAPNGLTILKDKVSRLYPEDDCEAKEPGEADQQLCDVMQEALQTHFQGLKFRERNAGRQIDEHMRDQGFDNEIGVDLETGFIFGGNKWNCGTWMDKMGSSEKASIKGVPATPRNGSAVEIVGLAYSVIKWLAVVSAEGSFPYNGVKRCDDKGNIMWTYKQWAEKILLNFEKRFYINEHDEYVNQQDIYKDTVGATNAWADYQMRCNFPIAMAIAPELFHKEHAWKALQKVGKILLGPLGMKTLDPSDWAYRGNYDNSNDSEDPAVADGFNYHQGPEWLWPVGFYFRALLYFSTKLGCVDYTLTKIREALSRHWFEIQSDHWRGLPELTNKNGSFCKDSCRTQAWSVATLLELLYDIEAL